MLEFLSSLRDLPAFWGLCGGILNGVSGLIPAYSAKAGNPLARRKAWLHLVLGLIGGPIVAEALTPSFIAIVPALDMRALSLILGWLTANDPRGLFAWLRDRFVLPKNGEQA